MPTGGTIIAQASPGGFSSRAIIRLSGPDTADLLEHTLTTLAGHDWQPTPRLAQPARFVLGDLTLPVLAIFFRSPSSFTGEDAAEIILPGNPHLIDRVMDAMLALPALPSIRRADPGEFSARAYLNDKLTLEQAEGIAQLIGASSERERAAAHRLMAGQTSTLYQTWADELATLLALVEAGIDFTDQEDVVAIAPASLDQRLGALIAQVQSHAGARTGRESGSHLPSVVLVGPPNAGKSTLFNALLHRPRAVVSDEAGTTRDALTEQLDLAADLPGAGVVLLTDLAGLDARAAGAIDLAAQARARDAIARADVVLLCDPSGRFAEPIDAARRSDATTIRVRTKGDLPALSGGIEGCDEEAGGAEPVSVCALDGWNLGLLRRSIADAAGGSSTTGVPARHRRSLGASLEEMHDAHRLVHRAFPASADAELVAQSLRSALDALGELVGHITPDDVIGRIFATFCVGK